MVFAKHPGSVDAQLLECNDRASHVAGSASPVSQIASCGKSVGSIDAESVSGSVHQTFEVLHGCCDLPGVSKAPTGAIEHFMGIGLVQRLIRTMSKSFHIRT
ncbi:hypothetical protein JCM4814A_90260 [Streptomyces phaeofaciens JCM 4814]